MCLVFRKSACPFGQVKTKGHLPVSPFSKNSPAGARGKVLMSVPGINHKCLNTSGPAVGEVQNNISTPNMPPGLSKTTSP